MKKKEKKQVKIKRVGSKSKTTRFLWLLLSFSLVFAIYKNFTAIDKHTVHEKEVVSQEIVDTNNIESFVTSFAYEFYSWTPTKEAIEIRLSNLNDYLTTDLYKLNENMIRTDIPTTSIVENVVINQVASIDKNTFAVKYSVFQSITENDIEKVTATTYIVSVRLDGEKMIIITNPAITTTNDKLEYNREEFRSDEKVTSEERNSISEFLISFFTQYPTIDEKEIAYYVSNNSLQVINKEYIFSQITSITYTSNENGNVDVHFYVEYIDNLTKSIQMFEYNLELSLIDGNYKIVDRK